MRKTNSKLDTESSHALIRFGLSLHEANTYVTLLRNGPMMAKEVAQSIAVLPNATYRLLQKLEDRGLIVSTGRHPNTFKALPTAVALESLAKRQMADIETNKEFLLARLSQKAKTDQTKIEVLASKRDFFRAYVDMAKQAKKEIDIISIGEEVPEDIIIVNRDCLERGVIIRFIVHRYDEKNKDLLMGWLRMGLLVRHYPDWGFHLVVYDNRYCLLAVNNPKNTDDRLSMKIFSEALSKSLGDYFNNIWEKAIPIH